MRRGLPACTFQYRPFTRLQLQRGADTRSGAAICILPTCILVLERHAYHQPDAEQMVLVPDPADRELPDGVAAADAGPQILAIHSKKSNTIPRDGIGYIARRAEFWLAGHSNHLYCVRRFIFGLQTD